MEPDGRFSYLLISRARSRCLGGVLIASASFWASCSFFSPPPPLPRQAAIESASIPAADAKIAALVQSADLIYFPSESLGSSGRYESAWKLVEALHRESGSFALGWDAIRGNEQSLLDRWTNRTVATDDTISALHLQGSAREVEICRRLLRDAASLGVHFLGLADDAAGEQFAAATISRYFEANRAEKILVFFHRAHLGRDHGVPYLVAQKVRARQLVFDSKPSPTSSPQLLAGGLRRNGWRSGGSLEIVDGPPVAGGDLP